MAELTAKEMRIHRGQRNAEINEQKATVAQSVIVELQKRIESGQLGDVDTNKLLSFLTAIMPKESATPNTDTVINFISSTPRPAPNAINTLQKDDIITGRRLDERTWDKKRLAIYPKVLYQDIDGVRYEVDKRGNKWPIAPGKMITDDGYFIDRETFESFNIHKQPKPQVSA
jgi:hypothetical protein